MEKKNQEPTEGLCLSIWRRTDIIRGGKLVCSLPPLKEIREYAQRELDSFWDEYKRLDQPHVYKVDLSEPLWRLKNELLESVGRKG